MEQFLPLIIIAILSFLFNRNKKQEKPPAKRAAPSRPQPEWEDEDDFEEDRREFKPYPTPVQGTPAQPAARGFQSLKEAAEAMLAKARPDLEEQERAAAEKMEALKREEERLLARAEKLKSQARSKAAADDAVSAQERAGMPGFTQNDVLNGIIMAEVLGKPRAKNPYQMRK